MNDLTLIDYIGMEVKAEIMLDGEINEYCGMLTQSPDSGLYSIEGTKSIYGVKAFFFESIALLKC